MTPAETLRSAATLMRQRADKAPSGPWRVEAGHLGGMPEYVMSADDGGAVAESWREPGAAAHCASWHPLVALAVADWLEIEAAVVERQLPDGSGVIHQALAVARAYLGEGN
jgi:hypothetical protein